MWFVCSLCDHQGGREGKRDSRKEKDEEEKGGRIILYYDYYVTLLVLHISFVNRQKIFPRINRIIIQYPQLLGQLSILLTSQRMNPILCKQVIVGGGRGEGRVQFCAALLCLKQYLFLSG